MFDPISIQFASQKATGLLLPPTLFAGIAAQTTVPLSAAPRKAGHFIVMVLPHPVGGSFSPSPPALDPLPFQLGPVCSLLSGLPTS